MNNARSLSPAELPGHPQTVAIFEHLAEGFDVDIQTPHTRYWRSMLTVGRAIDSLVDTHKPASLENESKQLIRGLPIDGVTDEEAAEFSDVYHSVTMQRRSAIREGLAINEYALAMREASTYDAFLKLRTEEAELFGRVMQLDNPDEQHTIGAFNNWLPRFARAGYLIDSFGDFSEDYKDGIIGLEPNLERRLKLGWRALNETVGASRELPPRTISFLAIASLSKMARNGLRKK